MNKEELEMRFISFVTVMGSAAMQQLGKVADPMSGKATRDLLGAKSTIDLLMMLKEKTKNNLSNHEESALNSILSNLQLNYVDESSKPEIESDQQVEKPKTNADVQKEDMAEKE
ncbi:MAG: DUF1844 domain-containing protein [Chlamydiota bacterium]|nr:DUF1844 domain-containing protein [Chlamydiota bacterium]